MQHLIGKKQKKYFGIFLKVGRFFKKEITPKLNQNDQFFFIQLHFIFSKLYDLTLLHHETDLRGSTVRKTDLRGSTVRCKRWKRGDAVFENPLQ